MATPQTLTLFAHNPERNHHRRYSVTTTTNLFGELCVIVNYGRVGKAGRTEEFPCSTLLEAQQLIEQRLARRKGAVKRIGVSYEAKKA